MSSREHLSVEPDGTRTALPLMQQELRNWRSSIRKRCSHWIWNIKGSANYELAGIAEKAYNALCNGETWEAVKKQYDKDNDEFVLRHVWD